MNNSISFNHLYFGNLSYDVTEDDLRGMLSSYGAVEDIQLKQKKGYAIIHFTDTADAELVMKSLEEVPFLGRKLVINWAKEPGKSKKPDTVA
ncbi:MAG: RNA-binding protein [Spirochaetales bacterium]|nr:RNA-binding protein [Spirochaetales bacterium]